MTALLIGIFLSLSACTGAGERETIRIGVNAWPPCEVWYVAQEEDLFDGVNIELVRFSSWSDNMRSLYEGKIDITHATYFNAAYFADKGEDGTIVQVIDTVEGGDGLVLRAPAGEASRPWPGMRVGVEVFTDEHFLLELALGDFGMTLSDVEPVALPTIESYQAFVDGTVDAIFTYDPYLHDAEASGGTIVWTTADRPGYMIDVLVARNEVIDARDKAVRQAIDGWHRALDFTADNPERAFEIMAANEEMSPADFGAFFGAFTFFTAEDNQRILTTERAGARLEEMLEFLRARGTTEFDGHVDDLFSVAFTPGTR